MAVARRPARGAPLAPLLLFGCLVCLAVVALTKWEGAWGLEAGGSPKVAHASGSSGSSSLRSRTAGHSKRALRSAASPPVRPSDAPTRQKPGEVPEAVKQRCRGTRGTWCVDFYTQEEVPARTAPRGNKTCSLDCNKVGVCNALSGLCTCPAGWTGFNCLHPMKRYCTHKYRDFGFEVERVEPNLTAALGPTGTNTFQFTLSHCAGFCDEDVAACFCPSNTTYGRIPAPIDAPQGSPPVQYGRPMGHNCQPNKLPDGRETPWGSVDPEDLFGPQGWCTAAEPKMQCDCYLDGRGGKNCEEHFEQFCFNQCNGRGECMKSYCKCDPGWHGIDCAHRSATADASRPGREKERPWIAEHVHTPAAQDFPAGAARKRPLIYIYELPAEYSTLLLQYRHGGEGCMPRFYTLGNETSFSSSLYNLESGFLEMLLQSEHRTLDPEEADFFYVPVFPSCFIEYVRNGADSLRDMYYGIHQLRVQSSANLMLEAYHWLRSHHPYWDRRGGRDHIWLVTFDEASCYVPSALRSSVILTQWGRKDVNHSANTGYWEDEYSVEYVHPQWEPDGFLRKIQGHACYDPEKDLTLPSMKTPSHFHASPLIGAPSRNRTWLAFHKGRVQMHNPTFSRGIRQRLAVAAKEDSWRERYRIVVGEYDEVDGDYSELLSSSTFCLHLPGDGWSARMEDAMLHGCIPVIIMDNVSVSFEDILQAADFTIRIPEADAEKLPEVLQAVPEKRIQEMQAVLQTVWQRFTWSSYRPFTKEFKSLQQQHAGQSGVDGQQIDPTANDAFHTVLAWLHSRINSTR